MKLLPYSMREWYQKQFMDHAETFLTIPSYLFDTFSFFKLFLGPLFHPFLGAATDSMRRVWFATPTKIHIFDQIQLLRGINNIKLNSKKLLTITTLLSDLSFYHKNWAKVINFSWRARGGCKKTNFFMSEKIGQNMLKLIYEGI